MTTLCTGVYTGRGRDGRVHKQRQLAEQCTDACVFLCVCVRVCLCVRVFGETGKAGAARQEDGRLLILGRVSPVGLGVVGCCRPAAAKVTCRSEDLGVLVASLEEGREKHQKRAHTIVIVQAAAGKR